MIHGPCTYMYCTERSDFMLNSLIFCKTRTKVSPLVYGIFLWHKLNLESKLQLLFALGFNKNYCNYHTKGRVLHCYINKDSIIIII